MEYNKVYCKDWIVNGLPDKCAQLIIADPPYHEVKGKFDYIWKTFDDYLKDIEKWAIECKRVLADNGTLFWWGHPLKIAYSQIILDKYFNLLNNIVWQKNDCRTLKSDIKKMRRYAPVTERLLMYDKGDDKCGTSRINDDNMLFIPIKKYFDNWLDKSGITLKEAFKQIGYSCMHWFGYTMRDKTQFAFPTKQKWEIMDNIFKHTTSYEDLRTSYEDLRTSYEDLRTSYEDLRRPFKLNKLQSDVFKFSQESHITKHYDHDTKKPDTLTRFIILNSTNKEDLVVVPFAGSGTECAMCAKENRKYIGFDIEQIYVDMSNSRCKQAQSKIQF